jgi:signal transduction histidine kinase
LGRGLSDLEESTLAEALGPQASTPLMRIFASGEGEAAGDPETGRIQLVLAEADAPAKVMDVAWALVEDQSHHVAAQAVLRDVTLQREREESLRLYAQQMTLAQERERQRIARELHDEAVQMLVSLCQGLDQLGSAHQRGSQAPTPDALREQAKQALASIRRFARNLRPTLLDDLGLIAAIHWLVSDMAQRLSIDARMETAGPSRRLPNDVEITLFRVVQEALRNTERHAHAAHVLVEVDYLDSGVTVSITDDGEGFTPPTPLRSLACQGHLGLLGMQERIQMIGGSLSVSSSLSEGARITVYVPDTAESLAAVG